MTETLCGPIAESELRSRARRSRLAFRCRVASSPRPQIPPCFRIDEANLKEKQDPGDHYSSEQDAFFFFRRSDVNKHPPVQPERTETTSAGLFRRPRELPSFAGNQRGQHPIRGKRSPARHSAHRERQKATAKAAAPVDHCQRESREARHSGSSNDRHCLWPASPSVSPMP